MDGSSFDRIARALGAVSSRRAGIKAAAAAAFGLGAADALAKPARKDRPGAAGPCKSTKRKDNVCTRNSECCTNICDTTKGKANNDRRGRCRCVPEHGKCAEDRNCCSRNTKSLICVKGRCERKASGPPVPTGQPCVKGASTCVDRSASCTTYTYTGAPAGTFCLLPDNVLQANAWTCTVNAECRSGRCADVNGTGKCAPLSCNVCQSHEVNAACPFSSIQAYMDSISGTGGDVQVFEGSYFQGLLPTAEVDWHIFPCCDDCYPVIGPATGDSYALAVDVNNAADRTVLVERMNFSTTQGAPTERLIQVWGYTDGPVGYMNLTLDDIKVTLSATDQNSSSQYANFINAESGSKVTISNSSLVGLGIRSNFEATEASNTLTLINTTLAGYGGTGLSYTGIGVYDTAVTLTNSTVRAWYSTGGGGGMWLWGREGGTSLTMDATSLVTANVSNDSDQSYGNNGSGIQWGTTMAMTGASATNVKDNGVTPFTAIEQCATQNNTACW